jgi:putative phosphoesterase
MTTQVIGVISDTHGLLRDEAKAELDGVDKIILAGDIGKSEVMEELQKIAPLIVIKGNVDRGQWAQDLPDTVAIEIEGHRIYVIHNLAELDVEPEGHFSVVVSGHSHIPKCETKGNVIYFNPGSIGPRRFRLPVSMGKLHISKNNIKGELINLKIDRS